MIKIERNELKDKFTLGIDFLDEDYAVIFKNIRTALSLAEKKECDKKRLNELLSKIKLLTEKHFEAEEGYIRFEGSRSFMFHKHCHELIKDRLFPALDKEIADGEVSSENVKKILGAFLGMFSAHILFEDGKLKDKTPVSLKYKYTKDHSELQKSVSEALSELTGIKTQTTDESTSLSDMSDSFAYERNYNLNDCSTIKIKAAFEEAVILYFFEDAFKIKLNKGDTASSCALLEFTREASLKLSSLFKIGSVYACENEKITSLEDIKEAVNNKTPDYSLSFKIGDRGFIIFADKI